MAIMYIPRQRSPWEQMLPQILGQMALMKVQQNYRAKEQEMEFAGQVGIAGGKELMAEEIKTPVQEGYRRFKYKGKTYRVPITTEERLAEKGIYKLGTELYRDLGEGQLQRITTKEYQPQLFTNPKTGEQKWISPGEKVPTDFIKAYKPTKTTAATLQKEWEWLNKLPPDERKAAMQYIRERQQFDPMGLIMMRSIWGGELPEGIGEEIPETTPLPGETAEEYLDRIERLQ